MYKICAALAVSSTGCGGMVDGPLNVDMAMNGYEIPCTDVIATEGMTPLSKDNYCGKGQETAKVAPSIYLSNAADIRDALNCALEGLINVNINNDVHQAPQQETLFIGGVAQDAGPFSEYSGKTVSSSDGHFFSMAIDHKPSGDSELSCEVMVTLVHELGHGLENNAALKGANFASYGLDEYGHDPMGTNAVMASGAKCSTSLDFSDGSARLITENLHPKNAHPEKLTNITTRCADQLNRVNSLPTPPK